MFEIKKQQTINFYLIFNIIVANIHQIVKLCLKMINLPGYFNPFLFKPYVYKLRGFDRFD